MPTDQRNLITAKATRLIFFTVRHRFSPRGAFWHTAVCPMYSSGTYQCPPLCSIHLCWQWNVLIWWLHVMASFNCVMEIPYCSYWLLWLQRYFSNSSWFILLCNKLKIPDRERQWILQFQTIAGAHVTIVFPHSGYCDYRRTFRTDLNSYCCVTGWTWQTKNSSGCFSLRYNWGTRNITTLWCRMCGFISQSILLFAKKVNKLVYY